jgi:hypothetical protein
VRAQQRARALDAFRLKSVRLGAAGSWWTARRAVRRLRLARYWQADGDLDEAAGHARHALGLVHAHPAPVAVAVEVAVVAARIERDRDNPAESQANLTWAAELLDAEPAGDGRDRLLSRVLVDLGDCHRRAGRYP